MVTASPDRTDGIFVAADPTSTDVPTLTEVLALKKDSELYFRGFHDDCTKVDTYYYGRNIVAVPDRATPVHTATARATINTATDHVDVDNLAIDIPLASLRAKARAERIKKFLQGVWLQIDPAIKQDAVKHAFAYGIGFMKVMYESDKYPEAPREEEYPNEADYKDALEDFLEARRINFPITLDVVRPSRMVWDDSRTGPRWAIEFYERADVRWLKMRYPLWTGKTESNGIVNWMEYWDDEYFMYIANNEIVAEGHHGYGFMPYVPIKVATSMSHDDGPPHERYQGLLHGRWDLLDEIDRQVSQHQAIIHTYAWPTIDFIGPPHLVEQARQNYELFGSYNAIPAGVTVTPAPRPQPPGELMGGLNLVQTLFEEATYPNVIRGARPKGVSSGFGVSVLAGMGRLVFQPIATGMAKACEEVNKNFLRLIENKVKGTLTVHARTEIHQFDESIGPRDIRGYYENKVTLKAESPEEREREAILAMRLWNNGQGLISEYEAMRRSGVANPLEMQVDKTAEQLQQIAMQSPEFATMVMQRVGLLQQAAELLGQPGGGDGLGSMNLGGAQMQRPGEAMIQGQRVRNNPNTNGPAVFPQGMGGIDTLGTLGEATGGAMGMPSGQTVQ